MTFEDSNGKKQEKSTKSFELFLRKTFKGLLDPIAGFLLRIGLTPNVVTYLGLVFSIGAACLIGFGYITYAGILLLIAAPMDALDGSMARLGGGETKYGAFIDSVIDRYSELIIFCGLLIYGLHSQTLIFNVLVYAAAVGSVLVSYSKARAESVGFTAKVGILTRVERVLVLIPCLIINQPIYALWIIAVLANFTVLQRIFFVHKQAFQSR